MRVIYKCHEIIKRCSFGIVVGLFLAPCAWADGWLSFQGQTGLIDVPDASVLESQEVAFQGNNNFVSEGRDLDRALNYIFAFSLFPGLELSGRTLTNYNQSGDRVRNDLSGNAKLRLLDTKYFDFALGIQDFAGDAQNVESRYGVGTAHFGPVAVTAGYGDGPDRLRGLIGGVAWNVFDWARLVADYDSEFFRAGLGLRALVGDRTRIVLSTKLFSGDDKEDLAFGLSIRHAFGKTPKPIQIGAAQGAPTPATIKANAERQSSNDGLVLPAIEQSPDISHERTAEQVAGKLRDAGLSHVRVGKDSADRMIIKFENRRFWHNHLDGYDVVTRTIKTVSANTEGWALLEEKNGTPRSAVLLDADLNLQRTAWGDDTYKDVTWLTKDESFFLGTELRLEPRIDSGVATDFGLIDYDIALQPTLRFQFGHGLSFHVAAVVSGTRTDSFRDNGAFANRRQKSGLDEVFAQWTHRPLPIALGRLSVGIQRFGENDFSVLDYEGLLHSPSGRHQIHAHIAGFDNQDVESQSNQELYIGSYRLWWWEQDLSLTLSYGQFFGEDQGGRVILRRYIGDLIVGLFVRRDNDGEQVGGLSVSLPLTPRVGLEPRHGAYVVGQPRFQYAINTTIDGPGGRNVLRPNFLVEPGPNYNLRRDFLDSDRALPGYIRNQWAERRVGSHR